MRYFETRFLEEANEFIAGLDIKTDNKETLVIATHGFVKKSDKVPKKEIERAVRLKEEYFENKQIR